jgi:4-aminobutyrate--pyruvate transaminase
LTAEAIVTVQPNSTAGRDIVSVIHPYTNLKTHIERGPVVVAKGKGIYIFDDQGKEYIEAIAGLWCASLGFDEKRLVQAATRQMEKLPFYHCFIGKSHDPGIDLAEMLLKMMPVPMSKVLFSNSGSEANDTAVKLVWYYNNAIGRPDKKKIVSRLRAYHGVTVAAASLTGLPNNHRDFDLPIPNIIHTAAPYHYREGRPGESEEQFATRLAAELDAQIRKEGPDTVAAFIAEPVMGAGGVIVPPRTYFEKIQAVLKQHDVLFIADEVICGFGRTGNMFGTETFGLKPDMITLAKQLSAAYMPISATVVSERIFQALVKESEKIGVFAHGTTYAAHPVAAAVAVETLKIYEERKTVDHVREVAPRFQKRLRELADHPLVGDARGVGLIGALELVRDKASRAQYEPSAGVGALLGDIALEKGLIVRALADTIALCPPLIISESEIDDLFNRLEKSLDLTLEEVRRRKAA